MIPKIFGDDGERVTPVPIPNTEVKPFCADGTWREASWESRTSPELLNSDFAFAKSLIILSSSVVEHSAVNRGVAGSSPAWGAIKSLIINRLSGFFKYNI